MNLFLPSTQMKLQPWAKAFSNFQPELPKRQDALYSFFSSRMMGGSNPVTAALQRVGPIGWIGPMSNTKKYKKAIQSWTKVGREMGSRNMNCWEAVYYIAYQAGTMSKNECTKQALFFQGYHKADITALRSHLGAPVPTPRMGDIVVWHSHIIDHVALYLGAAPQSPELNVATGSAEFIWQNSGLSCWGIQQTGCGFTHIAPFQKVKQNTKAPVSFFRPTWWF